METKRLNWINMEKGLAMIGHAPFLSFFIAEVYTFRLPLFFFLSGYLFSDRKYRDFRIFLKRKFTTLVI